MEKSYFGVMLDMSRNGVMKVSEVKRYVDYLKAFGYNSLQLYTEDTYEVDGEPYFGHLRGRYTKEELKEIDAYCNSQGIELIPCMQALAHLNAIFNWGEYYPICDTGDILLAGDERTYRLIDDMFKTIAECFTSRRINVGMDEAHMVGLGKYLDKHGYRNRFDILKEHLDKVIEIASKYGFKVMMWGDMFLRLANNGNYYGENVSLPDEVKAKVPKDVTLIYWDYYEEKQSIYDSMIKTFKKLDRELWFAGGAWSWTGFAPNNKFSLKTTSLAMKSCRENGINNIFMTIWGDNGSECSYFAVLPVLYYAKRVYDGVKCKNQIKKEFFELTGESFDDMIALDLPNEICGNKCTHFNPCKYAFYADLLNGMFDTVMVDGGGEDYKRNARILKNKGKRSKNFGYIFESLSALCDFMSIKYDLGKEIRKAYKAGDKEKLKGYLKELSLAIKKAEVFHAKHYALWMKENKPQGFEVQDARIGGLIQRLKTYKNMLNAYIEGTLDKIAELEEPILDMTWEQDGGNHFVCYNGWRVNVTAGVM